MSVDPQPITWTDAAIETLVSVSAAIPPERRDEFVARVARKIGDDTRMEVLRAAISRVLAEFQIVS
jgi:hypothetical protein